MVEESGGVRDRKVLAGEGMVTPVRPIIVNGGKERLSPSGTALTPITLWCGSSPRCSNSA